MVFAKTVDASDYETLDDTPKAGDNSLAVVRALAEEQLAAEQAVEDAQKALAAAQQRLRDVAEVRLPNLMEENRLPEFTFDDPDGTKLKIKLDKRVTATPVCEHRARPNAGACDACKARLYKWLKDIGESGSIKHNVVIPVGLVPQKNIDSLMKRVRELRKTLEPIEDKKVEPATLSAIVSARAEAGKEVDQSIVKINRMRATKVERKRPK